MSKKLQSIKEIAEVSDTGEPQSEDVAPRSQITPIIEEAPPGRPWIVSASRDEHTFDVTIRFIDNSEVVKLGVSTEDYKAFEATFGESDWQESSLAFLYGGLGKYNTAE